MSKRLRSFAFYLGMGYLIVYALCTGCIYFLSSRAITKTVRGYDRQDVRAESEELVEILNQNAAGNWLAEQVTLERYPPSTLFIVRVINTKGLVEYTITWPKKIDLPDWENYTPEGKTALPPVGVREYYLKPLRRHIQIQTTKLKDGRLLQVGKGSFIAADQKTNMAQMLLIFAALSTLFSFISGVFMMIITLRPIRRITDAMGTIIATSAFEKGAPPVNSMITELDDLGKLFTVMTEKYANLIQAMRQTMDNVAHDFRTPLTRIRGAAEMALCVKDLQPELAEALADIIEDCDRAKLQLQNLMDARQMESGFVKLNVQPFSLTQVITEIIDLYSLIAEEKNIQLKADFPPDEIILDGDKQRLARAFANLVDNAVKYTPKKGSVTIRFDVQPETVTTSVIDNGIGIPEDEQGLIWQRLFRGKQAREADKGLGLGLNIVQIIIAAHGGTATVISAPGQGATFCITLPRSASRPAA